MVFGKKKKQTPAAPVFLILDSSHAPLKRFDAVALPLHRNVVLEKSVEFFQDPNPCAIHEGVFKGKRDRAAFCDAGLLAPVSGIRGGCCFYSAFGRWDDKSCLKERFILLYRKASTQINPATIGNFSQFA